MHPHTYLILAGPLLLLLLLPLLNVFIGFLLHRLLLHRAEREGRGKCGRKGGKRRECRQYISVVAMVAVVDCCEVHECTSHH